MGLEIRGVDKKRRSIAMEYIKTSNLSRFQNLYPRQLSGGMKQRVAIARTLIMNPRVVLMDEPFGPLDSQTRDSMQEFLLSIWQKRMGTTLIFATHNVEEAVFLSDEIVVFSKRPARIVRIVEVEIPRPRDRTSQECNQIRKEILQNLDKEIDRQRKDGGDEGRWHLF